MTVTGKSATRRWTTRHRRSLRSPQAPEQSDARPNDSDARPHGGQFRRVRRRLQANGGVAPQDLCLPPQIFEIAPRQIIPTHGIVSQHQRRTTGEEVEPPARGRLVGELYAAPSRAQRPELAYLPGKSVRIDVTPRLVHSHSFRSRKRMNIRKLYAAPRSSCGPLSS